MRVNLNQEDTVRVKCPQCGRKDADGVLSGDGKTALVKCVGPKCKHVWIEPIRGSAQAGGARLLVLAALALIGTGFAVGGYACPREKEIVRYSRPIVSVAEMMKNLPDVNLSLAEKVTKTTVRPQQVAVAPRGAVVDVNEFCRAGGYELRAETPDGADAPQRPTVARPPVLPKSYGKRDGRDYTLSLPLSNGDRPAFHFKVRGNEYEWVTDGDSIVFHQDRFWWVRPAVKGAGLVGLGYTVGRIAQ